MNIFQQGEIISFNSFVNEAKRDPEVQKYRERLSLSIPGSKFQLSHLEITNYLARKTLKCPFTKKLLSIKIKTAVFRYYKSCLRNSLKKLTLAQSLFDRAQKEKKTRFPGFFKHLQTLVIQSNSGLQFLKSARKIAGLQELYFKIFEHDIPMVKNLFRGFFKLETLDLRILSSPNPTKFPSKSEKTWRFFKDLANLKRLKTLKLLINDCEISREANFFDHLMEILSESSSIENLDLILYMQNFEDSEPSEKAKKMLSKIENLHVEFVTKSNNFAFGKLRPDETEEKMMQMKKKVTLYFSGGRKIDIAKMMTSRFTTAKCLKIIDPVGFIIFSPKTKFTLPALEIIKIMISHKDSQKVENIVSYMAKNFKGPQMRCFEMEFNNFTDEILKEFIKLHASSSFAKLQSYSLATQDVLPWNQAIKDAKGIPVPIKMASNDAYDNFMESFSRLASLKKLRFLARVKDALYLKSIGKLFDYLTNLLELDLVMIERDPTAKIGEREPINIELPIYKLANLRSLKLVYNENLKIEDFLGLLEKMSKLEDLESLTIESEGFDLKDRKFVESIALILGKFPKCKRLGIGPKKNEGSKFQRTFIEAKIIGSPGKLVTTN